MRKRLMILTAAVFAAATAFCGGSQEPAAAEYEKIRIAVMPDAGALPFYLMDSVEPVPFMSARERDAAMQLGELDGMMSDLVSVLMFHENGMKLRVITINESRFMIIGSELFEKEQQWSVGISENSIIEFMVDQLASDQAAAGKLDKVAIPAVPVRLEMLRGGKVPMACLTEAMAWTLDKESFPIVRDQRGSGLEPAVLVFSEEFSSGPADRIEKFKADWTEAVEKINSDPEAYRNLMLEKLSLPDDENDPYPIPEFRAIVLPPEDTYSRVVDWFDSKYGSGSRPSYDEIVIY